MSLEEETTEVEETTIEQEIKMVAQDLHGKDPGDIEETLVEISIVDALSRHHGWSDRKVREVYNITFTHEDGHWDVLVEPKDA